MNVVAVGGSADHQALWLRDTKGIGLPLLLDPDQQVRSLTEVGDLGIGLLRPGGMVKYVRAFAEGARQKRPTRDAGKAPGVAVFGPDLDLRWTHVGRALGDYPTVDELIERVDALR